MKKLLWLVIVLVLVASLVGCGRNRNYTGTWVMNGALGGTMVINSDGTGTVSGGFSNGQSVSWHKDGDHIVITDPQGKDTANARLSEDGKSLTLTDTKSNTIIVFVRQG